MIFVVHVVHEGKPFELVASKTDELVALSYRQVRANRCLEKFSSVYGGFEDMAVVRVADVTVTFHRSAVHQLYTFALDLQNK